MIIKTKTFDRWAKKTAISDAAIIKAVDEMARGLVDAELGGGVFKKRVALPGKGKSGGVRTLLATNLNNRWFFIFGFEKSDRSNVSAKELEVIKAMANDLLSMDTDKLMKAITDGVLVEVKYEKEK
jgi:hypothetical protein